MIKDFLLENNVALNEMFSFGKDDNFLIPILIFKKTTKIYFGSKVTNDEIKSFVNYFNFVKTDKLDLNEFNRNLANYNNHKVNINKKIWEDEKKEENLLDDRESFKITKIFKQFIIAFNEFLFIMTLNNKEMKLTNRINYWLENYVELEERFKIFFENLKKGFKNKSQKIFLLKIMCGLITSKINLEKEPKKDGPVFNIQKLLTISGVTEYSLNFISKNNSSEIIENSLSLLILLLYNGNKFVQEFIYNYLKTKENSYIIFSFFTEVFNKYIQYSNSKFYIIKDNELGKSYKSIRESKNNIDEIKLTLLDLIVDENILNDKNKTINFNITSKILKFLKNLLENFNVKLQNYLREQDNEIKN